MTISKFEYSQKIGLYGDQIKKAANEYADYASTANFKTQEDLEEFKRGWLLLVDDFRVIQSNINELEIPEGHETKGKELRKVYQRYVDCIEEKTMKFGTIDRKEIDLIQRLELDHAGNIKKVTKELKKELFD